MLYTNGSGLASSPDLALALQDVGLTRLELSRCHDDERINQKIMRFNCNQAVRHNAAYKAAVRWLHHHLAVKNSCILTRSGIVTVPDVERYLA